MKLSFTKHFRPSLLSASVFLFLVSSCSKVEDLYKAPEGESSKLITDVKISDNFNWATTATVDVRIAVDDRFDGNNFYKLEIFDREPYAEGAVLLGAGAAKKGQDLVTKITVPTFLSYVYVLKTTPTGEKSYTMLALNEGGVSNGRNLAKVATVNVGGLTRLASTAVTPTYNRVPEPAKPTVSASNQLNGSADFVATVNNGIYVIEKDQTFSGNIDLANNKTGIVVYVKGTWSISNKNIVVENSNKIIVLTDGKIEANSLGLKHTSKVQNYGTISVNTVAMHNKDVVIENYKTLSVAENTGEMNGKLYNFGTLTAEKNYSITADPSLVHNEGTIDINGTISLASKASFINHGVAYVAKMKTANENIVENNGKMTIDVAEFNNTQFYVNCYTKVGEMKFSGSNGLPKVFVRSAAKLEIGNLLSGSAVYNLAGGSILNVTGKATFDSSRSTIYGESGSGIAMAIMDTIVSQGWEAITYSGSKLEVYTNHHTENADEWDRKYIIADGAHLNKTTIVPSTVIAGTTCNAGGAGVQPTNPPVDQLPGEIGLGTYSFAFEDNWPYKGDYDMNDLVIDVQVVKYQNAANKVEKVVLKNKIRSLGARYRLAAAIQLDNVLASNVKSAVYSKSNVVNTSVRVLPLSNEGIEIDQEKAVVTIVDDVHTAFGQPATGTTQFVFTDGTNVAPFETEVTITFNTPLDNFTQDHLNPFIVVNYDAPTSGGKRKEVHLVGHHGTDKIISSLITREQEAKGTLSAQDPFKTKSNEPFALSLPLSFKYPREAQSIAELYPDLKSWVESNGQFAKDWYNSKK